MNTHVRHLNTKFLDDSTDPAQLTVHEVGKTWIFWTFQQQQEKIFAKTSNDVTLFCISQGIKISFCGQVQSCHLDAALHASTLFEAYKNICFRILQQIEMSSTEKYSTIQDSIQ